MSRLFGTDGVRGVANTELTPELAFNLGKVGTYVLSKSKQNPLVLIGKDTRLSGDLLENAITSGILSMGGNVVKVGILPTPAIAYLVKHMKADAGVMISASHNTYEFNGIKFFNSEGFKLDDDIEDEIEDIIVRDMDVNSHIEGDRLGRCIEAVDDGAGRYAEFLKSTIDVSLEGMKLVIDCANGAAYRVAEKVFKDLGAQVVVMGNTPDGLNINASCGSTHPEALQQKVLEEKADVGLAFDGDADRLISVDEKGRVVDGDKMIYICAKMLKEQGKLCGDKVTVTVMSNLGFHKAIQNIGAKVDVTQVGDRYVLESMLKTGVL
jgi:phosphoglucosamine mutase